MDYTKCPDPGIYPGVSFEDYRKVPAMNSSTLQWARVSMLHLKAAIDGRLAIEDSKAKSQGRAQHLALLEPERYPQLVHERKDCEVLLESGKRKGQPCGATGLGLLMATDHSPVWACGTHHGDPTLLLPGHEYLSREDLENIAKASKAVRDHAAENLRRAKGDFEVMVIADLCGVRVKCRLDKLIHVPVTIIDVKKVEAPASPDRAMTPEKFEYRLDDYNYGPTAAMYCDAVKAATGEDPRWYWLAVEQGEPFDVTVMRASPDCLTAGRNEYQGLLWKYKKALESNNWPGHQGVYIVEGDPRWLRRNGVNV